MIGYIDFNAVDYRAGEYGASCLRECTLAVDFDDRGANGMHAATGGRFFGAGYTAIDEFSGSADRPAGGLQGIRRIERTQFVPTVVIAQEAPALHQPDDFCAIEHALHLLFHVESVLTCASGPQSADPMWRGYASAMTLLRSTPRPVISISQTSPTFMFCGRPSVPIQITSPG